MFDNVEIYRTKKFSKQYMYSEPESFKKDLTKLAQESFFIDQIVELTEAELLFIFINAGRYEV